MSLTFIKKAKPLFTAEDIEAGKRAVQEEIARLERENDGLIRVSPTQIKIEGLCARKWAFMYIDRRPKKQSEAQLVGLNNHREIKEWLTEGKLPGPIAKQGIRPDYIPTPSKDLIVEDVGGKFERPLTEIADDILMIGEIDCIDPNEDPILLCDWKTTKSLKYAMTVNELREDEQAIIYSKVVMERMEVERLRARWVYFEYSNSTKMPTGTRKVETIFDSDHINKRWTNILEAASRIREMKRTVKSALHVLPDPTACMAFGGCEFIDICPVTPAERLGAHLQQFNKFNRSAKNVSTTSADSAITASAQTLRVVTDTDKRGIMNFNGIRKGAAAAAPKKNGASKSVANAAPAKTAPKTAAAPAAPAKGRGAFADRVRSLQKQNPAAVNAPESEVEQPEVEQPEAEAPVAAAPATAPARRGRPPKQQVQQPETEEQPQASESGSGLTVLFDTLISKGQSGTVVPLIEILQPSIEKICEEFQTGHWSTIENADAFLAGLLDEYLTEVGNEGGLNGVVVVVDSTTREARAVREVLTRHAGLILRGVVG